jgi:alpha-beta hydrolase superfamily lysophospholipase
MKFALEDSDMDGQLQRTAIAAYAGAADLGEALTTARRVIPGDYDSWYAEWAALAEKTAHRADDSARHGHGVTAAKAYLRATEYWRQAIFFIRHDLDDPRLLRGWRAHRAAFRRALPLLPWDTTIDEIPFDGGRMTAYLLRPRGDPTWRPTILAPCGFDSTAESGYAATGYMALARGYNVLLWDGPGQGGMLYEHRVPMRPDFEAVVSPVIDWLLAQQGVHPDGLVLIGRSFAGYLAPRAAAAEPRLAALVCDPGQVEFVSRIVPALFTADDWQRILAADPEVDQALQRQLDDPRQRELYGARMATFGAKTLGEFLRMQARYTVEDNARLIRCPTLVTEGEGDFASQGQKLFELLTCEKRFRRFAENEGAGGHCCGLGAALWEGVTFDWLDEVLARKNAQPRPGADAQERAAQA